MITYSPQPSTLRHTHGHLAPVGYCTLSEKGLILEANLTAAGLLNVERSALVNQPLTRFIVKEDQDTYYRHRKTDFWSGHSAGVRTENAA